MDNLSFKSACLRLTLGISVTFLVIHGFKSIEKKELPSTNTTSLVPRDPYNLGYGYTSKGEPCKITFNYTIENYGKFSDAVKYLDDFVFRQMHNTRQNKEIECFFAIDTSEYQLEEQEREDSVGKIKSTLLFSPRNGTNFLKIYTTYALTFTKNVRDESACSVEVKSYRDHIHNDIIKSVFCALLLIIAATITILETSSEYSFSLESRKFDIESENFNNIVNGPNSEQKEELPKDLAIFEHACDCETDKCSDACDYQQYRLGHLVYCEITPLNECSRCVSVMKLVCYHARTCKKEVGDCRVPGCQAVRLSLTKNAEKTQELDDTETQEAIANNSQTTEKVVSTEEADQSDNAQTTATKVSEEPSSVDGEISSTCNSSLDNLDDNECEDFNHCDSCQEKNAHPHRMEPVYSQERHESIQRCIASLVHACQCREATCRRLSCRKMKKVVQHTKICPRRVDGTCPICKQLIALCCHHAKFCSREKCSIPFCMKIRAQLAEEKIAENATNHSKEAFDYTMVNFSTEDTVAAEPNKMENQDEDIKTESQNSDNDSFEIIKD